jgi:hypothetical protein
MPDSAKIPMTRVDARPKHLSFQSHFGVEKFA